MNRLRALFCALSLLVVASAAGASPVAIANPSLAREKFDAVKLKSVFLGKRVSWEVGGRVIVAVLREGPVADAFLPRATGLSTADFRSYWRRLAMTGAGIPPKSFSTVADLKAYVARTPGAIGFADAADADGSVVSIPVP